MNRRSRRLSGRTVACAIAVCLITSPALAANAEEESTMSTGLTGVFAGVSSLVYTPLKIVYAAGGLSPDEISSVNFTPGDLPSLMKRYDVSNLKDGWQKDTDGSEFYFIRNPSLGLWRATV